MKKQYPTGPVTHKIRQLNRLDIFKQKRMAIFETLSDRETEVLQLIAQGKNNPKISQELLISRATVQNHRAMIRQKLDIKNEQGFMKYALAFNLIDF
ncbi:response regulator transcription factor [Lunatibacter salilacus]|uniref:response regulator transcription factor n=1 Tax=Lunatibacter salilacus TaxID=2483804 RepID=UPI00131B7E17|nr:helix-turn-helix transcriptional regulator [Lunatibacter salilacus]